MRLALIVNPVAVRVTESRRRVVEDALAGHEVRSFVTSGPRQVPDLVRRAVEDGPDAVLVFGGDGTVSDTFATLAGGDIPLGVLPGGGTNVMARTWGIPRDPALAVRWALERVSTPRRIGLGRAADRWFGFAGGMGFDALAVALADRRRRYRRMVGDAVFVVSAFEAFFRTDRRRPALGLHFDDGSTVTRVHHLVVANSSPFTFLGPLPLVINPGASLEQALSVTAFRRLNLPFTLAAVVAGFRGGDSLSRLGGTVVRDDLVAMRVEADRPVDLHLDGEHVGRVTEVAFGYTPSMLPVLID